MSNAGTSRSPGAAPCALSKRSTAPRSSASLAQARSSGSGRSSGGWSSATSRRRSISQSLSRGVPRMLRRMPRICGRRRRKRNTGLAWPVQKHSLWGVPVRYRLGEQAGKWGRQGIGVSGSCRGLTAISLLGSRCAAVTSARIVEAAAAQCLTGMLAATETAQCGNCSRVSPTRSSTA